MILNDLFEGRMSELDIEYQDYKNLEPVAFYSRYKMTKDDWASKNWSLIKSSETVHEGAMKDLHTELAEKYRELAPSIEKYKDSFKAGELYDALEAIAIEHSAELEFKRMMTGARNRAHMDYDTNPGGFQNWFWYLPFADDEQDVTEEAEDYAGIYSPEAIALGKKFCEFYNITEDTDVQLAVEIIDSYIDQFKQRGQPIDLKVIKSGVVDAFRQVYRGMGPGPNFRKKFQNRLDEKDVTEESQDDRNARIIAGEIEDAMSLGNEKVAQEKIKRLTQLGYYFDKQGRLQRMGMYEEQDACYRKVKSRYKVWPSAYASGALVQCRKKGAANWGNKTKK
jgi:hypothetical protein